MSKSLAAVVLALWVILTAARVTDWQDGLHLWATAMALAPEKARIQINFANELTKHGFPGLAETELRKVAERPDLVYAVHSAAEENIQRLHITEQDLQAWFRDEPLTVRLPSPR